MAEELGVVLRRALRWPLGGEGGVATRLSPPPDHRGRPVVEVEADAGRRVAHGEKRRDDDEEKVGVRSHDHERRWRVRAETAR